MVANYQTAVHDDSYEEGVLAKLSFAKGRLAPALHMRQHVIFSFNALLSLSHGYGYDH